MVSKKTTSNSSNKKFQVKFSLLVLFLLISLNCFSQNTNERLVIGKSKVYNINNKRLDYNQVMYKMKDNADALHYMKKAKASRDVAYVLYTISEVAFICGSVITTNYIISHAKNPEEDRIKNKALGYGLLASSFSLAFYGLCLWQNGTDNLKFAVSLHNKKIANKSSTGYKLEFGPMHAGLGIACHF